MSSTKYKYDVAISFAEEDKAVAEKIARSCEKIGLETYFYEDETAQNWGENLFNIIVNRYRDTARFALILISKDYVKKKWTDIERQIIQSVDRRSDAAYLLPLRLDDTLLEGMTDNTLYEEWRGDAGKIAEMIYSKIEKLNAKKATNKMNDANVGSIFNQNTKEVKASKGGFAFGNVGNVKIDKDVGR